MAVDLPFRPGPRSQDFLLTLRVVPPVIRQGPAAGNNKVQAGIPPRDPAVGRALAALHHQPQLAWTLAKLAVAAGVSRSALAERFMTLVGQPPMQYLLQWRMQLGARALEEGRKVTNVAYDVGYESEAAFSRAFKKLTGISPGAWRSRETRPLRSGAAPSRRHRAQPTAPGRSRLIA